MQKKDNLIQFDQIIEIVGEDSSSMKEFCEAAIISFTSFKEDYEKSVRDRDLTGLKKAGHRIKPAAKMVGLGQLITQYERTKKILQTDADHQKIAAVREHMEELCSQIIDNFRQKAAQL